MTLQVALTLDERELLYQQSTEGKVNLTNSGRRPIVVGLPPADPTEPAVHVFQTKTGVETIHRRPAGYPPSVTGQADLAPGAGVESGFDLLDIVTDLTPGEYKVRVSWGFHPGDERVLSRPVDLKVLPTTPSFMVKAAAAAGNSSLSYGIWVDFASEPRSLVRCAFALELGGGVSDLVRVGKAPPHCAPALSAPGKSVYAHSQWVAWLEGAGLSFTHVDATRGVLKPKSLALPTESARIVPPLFISPATGGPARPAGAALLCLTVPGANRFRLQTVELTQGAGKPRGAGDVKGRRPDWIHAHFRDLTEWLAVWIQVAGLDITLSRGDWPGMKARDVGAKELTRWSGTFLAAGSTTGADTSVHGGALIRERLSDDDERPVMVPWTLSPDNEYEEGDRREIRWDPRPPIARAKVYVSDDGLAVALIRDVEDVWHFFDGNEVVPVAPQVKETDQQLEVGFLGGTGEPLLISSRANLGFEILCMDGSPIPEMPI